MSEFAVANPLVLVGLGPMGTRVVDDLDDTARALSAPKPSPHVAVTTPLDKAVRFRRKLSEHMQTNAPRFRMDRVLRA